MQTFSVAERPDLVDAFWAIPGDWPTRLFESPYTDHAPTGPDDLFAETEVDSIVGILREEWVEQGRARRARDLSW